MAGEQSSSSSHGTRLKCLLPRLKLEDSLHQQPLLARFGLRQWLLKLPHQLLPLLDRGIVSVSLRFCGKRETLVDFHDHEHPGTEQMDFQVFDPRVSDALRNLGPDV